MTVLELPIPPSTNKLFRNVPGVGRVKTSEYVRWSKSALMTMVVQKPKPVKGSVRVEITCRRVSRRRDIDNIIKPTLDILVRGGLIEDDRHVISVTAEWVDRPPGRLGEVEVQILEVANADVH